MLHLSLAILKPFNPILGETFQTKIGDSLLYLEQTSHHPPIYTYYIKNPEYTAYGHELIEASTGANSVTAEHIGKLYIQFSNGGILKIKQPKFYLSGTTLGKRLVNLQDNLVVEDLTNHLIAVVKFYQDDRSYFKKLISSTQKFPDVINGFIAAKQEVEYNAKTETYTASKDGIYHTIEGEWTSHVNIDGGTYWKHGEYDLLPMERMEFTLPSDSTYRDDVLLFKNGNDDYAQEAKTRLEENQRNDRKLRAAHSDKKSHA